MAIKDTFDHDRCVRFIDAIEGATPATPSTVLACVTAAGLTPSDFIELDERPGQFGSYRDGTWHSSLRRVRNDPNGDLFDRLRKNYSQAVTRG